MARNYGVGNRRGEACVSLVAHATELIAGQTYYNGTKESQQPAVAQLLVTSGMQHQKITLDALHLIPLTISTIHSDGSPYLVGLKANQQALYRCWVCSSTVKSASYERQDKPQRGHGRIHHRSYACFDMSKGHLAPRWQSSGL